MNKKALLLSATVFGIIGAYIPFLFGDTDPLGGWSIFGGFAGGIFGIWLGVVLVRRLG
jgi:hypothetical protein